MFENAYEKVVRSQLSEEYALLRLEIDLLQEEAKAFSDNDKQISEIISLGKKLVEKENAYPLISVSWLSKYSIKQQNFFTNNSKVITEEHLFGVKKGGLNENHEHKIKEFIKKKLSESDTTPVVINTPIERFNKVYEQTQKKLSKETVSPEELFLMTIKESEIALRYKLLKDGILANVLC